MVDLVLTNLTHSAKICPNLHWGWSRPTQNKVPRSVQICILGGGLFSPDQLNPKFQDLSKSTLVWWSRPTQPKVPGSVQICILGGGGSGGGGFGPKELNP